VQVRTENKIDELSIKIKNNNSKGFLYFMRAYALLKKKCLVYMKDAYIFLLKVINTSTGQTVTGKLHFSKSRNSDKMVLVGNGWNLTF
jgi:hypothetical protein